MEKGRREKSGDGGYTASVEISVRHLVEFILRSGDIDNRRHANITDAMLEGAKIHRRIQGEQGSDYISEFPLSINIDCDYYRITVSGRADGIIIRDDKITVDEIKGTYADVSKFDEPLPLHLAQAMCYAYIYAEKEGLENIGIRMTYCTIRKDNIRYFDYDLSFGELSSWFEKLISEYKRWAEFMIAWSGERTDSIHRTEFPYEYREGQKELAVNVYRTIYHRKKLFLQAPTGVGKTLAVLFPSVKAIGEKKAEKIFYLTAKNAGATVANETYRLLRKKGLKFKTVNLMAKEKFCLTDECECNPEKCPYAKGHFDRINDAVFELLTQRDDYDTEVIKEHAEKKMVCPFEMALDLSLFCDGIVCDYNYAFDPRARLKRFFAEGAKGSYIFLVDEAHNLVDRGRDMYSSMLTRKEIAPVKKKIKGLSRALTRHLNALDKALKEKEEENDGRYRIYSDINAIVLSSQRFAGIFEDLSKEHPIDDEETVKLYFDIRAFLEIYDRLNEKYVIYGEKGKEEGFMIKLYNTDPSDNLSQCLEDAASTVFFSATLLPVGYYMDLIAGDRNDYAVYAKSVFDPGRLGVFTSKDVSSKYNRRSENEYRKIAEEIDEIVKIHKGNYMLFFPSYSFMENVFEIYEKIKNEDVKCLLQDRKMSENDRLLFLQNFDKTGTAGLINNDKITGHEEKETIEGSNGEKSTDDKITLVGFCVLGGVFSEGIDLTEESLIGAVIVGTGLPMVCTEREILKNYFESAGMDGFGYAYRIPGMNKVLQAAGRVIRTEKDAGIAVLMDERFSYSEYTALFPKEWVNTGDIALEATGGIRKFWDSLST